MSFASKRFSRDARQLMRSPAHTCDESHAVVLWTAAAFRRHPRDHLIWIHDVAGLAVHAVGSVDLQPPGRSLDDDLVHVGWTESLARMAVFVPANRVTHIRLDEQVRRLIQTDVC